MSQNLVPIASIDDKSSSSTSSGSSTGKTAGIAVGVIIGVLVIASAIGAYFFYRYKQNKRDTNDKALSDGSNPKENFIRQGYDKGELPTGNDNQRYEMLGSDPSQPKPPEPLVSPWVNEKANHPGAGPDMAEVDSGHVSVPELTGSQQRGVGHRPLHEMQDPSVPPTELPGDHPQAGELHGSNPTSPRVFARRSRRSNAASPVSHSSSTKRRSWRERLSGRPEASRSSTLDSLPSLTSSTGASPPAAPKEEVPVGSGHSGEPFSPVSRQGTFSPDPVSRQGTFSLDPVSRQGNFKSDNASNQLFSPVSPSSPETNRGMFERFEEPSK